MGSPPSGLVCRCCAATVPIVDGIPRLAGQPSLMPRASAGSGTATTWPGPRKTRRRFWSRPGHRPSDLAGQLVLDAGCGGGRYARLLGSHGARVIGVDLSAAVAKAAALCAPFAQRLGPPGRPARPAAGRRESSTWSIRSASCTIRPTRRRAFQRSPGASSRAGAWPCGSTAATRPRRNGSTAASARSQPACPRACSSPFAPAWARSEASRSSIEPSTRSPTFPTTPIGPCASATTSTGTPLDYQSHHSLDELKRWFAEEGFPDIVELAPAKNGASTTGLMTTT